MDKEIGTPKARKRWLRGQRKLLGWSYEEMARRLRCSILEYQDFESGKTEGCVGLSFSEIKEYMEWHLEGR
jgi:transcriptional regulator with XRE-family HTH domain